MQNVEVLGAMYSQEFGACSVQKGWREEIQVDLWLCRTSQAGTASQFVACAPQSLLQLYALKCCLGLTGYQQDWLNQLLEKSPGSSSKHSISSTETRAVLVPGTDSWAWLFWATRSHTEAPQPVTGRWQHLGASRSTGHGWDASHSWALLTGTCLLKDTLQ